MKKFIGLVLFFVGLSSNTMAEDSYTLLELKGGYDTSNVARVLDRAPVEAEGNCLRQEVEINIHVILNEGNRYLLDYEDGSEELRRPEDSAMISYLINIANRYNIPVSRNINRTRGYRHFILKSVQCRFDPSKSFFIKF